MTKLSLENAPAWSEVEDFLEKMRTLYRKKEAPLRDLVIMSLVPTTGIKVSELLALRKEDFLFNDGMIIVNNRNGSRRASIMPKIMTYVKEHVRTLKDGEIAFDLTRRQVLNISYNYSEQILGRRVRLDDWRHAFALRVIETIKDPAVCRALLGHKGAGLSKIYMGAAETDIRDELVRAMDR